MQSLNSLVQKLSQTGARLDNLERAVAAAKARLRFWQIATLISGAAAAVLFIAWRNANRRLRDLEGRNGKSAW